MALCGKCHHEQPDGALFCSHCGESIKPVTSPGETVDPLIGQTVAGKYFIHHLIGRGGMGDVYKATHLTLDRPIVLKLLKKLFQSDPSLVQRFHREARAASRLNHPNSITIIDFGQMDDGTLFMAMEFLAGRSLERVIVDEQPLPEARVIHIGSQILAALAEAHALGIIHRDLKPANVMIETRRDERDFVKVLDFGIAKLNEPGDGGGALTQAGIVCGTPGYMSTEQVRGEELDARSDLYAVGVILYEMLTGVLPFDSKTPMGLVTRHLVEDPPPLAVRRPGLQVSPELEGAILRALARDRNDRFASADEMRSALLACASATAAPSMRPTPAPSATAIFDPSVLSPSAARLPSSSKAQAAPSSGAMEAAPEAQPPPAGRTPSRPAAPAAALSDAKKTPAPGDVVPGAQPEQRAQAPAQKKETRPPAKKKTPAPAKAKAAAARPKAREESRAPSASRKAPIFIAAGVAMVLVIGVVVFFVTRGKRGDAGHIAQNAQLTRPQLPSQQVLPAQQVPLPSPPVEAPTPKPEPVPPLVVEPKPIEPEPVPAKREVKTASVARATKGIRKIGQEINSIATPSVSSGDGVLTILATPWAQVAIDGRDIGETPREVLLGAGTYRVKATHPAQGTREHTVTIRPGKRATWNATFAN